MIKPPREALRGFIEDSRSLKRESDDLAERRAEVMVHLLSMEDRLGEITRKSRLRDSRPSAIPAAIPAATDEIEPPDCERVLSKSRTERQMLSSLLRKRRLFIQERRNLTVEYQALVSLSP